jgi:hypothetical protein
MTHQLEHNEMLALLFCKHVKHRTLKALVDPRAQMIPTMQHWLRKKY